jgi:hypothetical protein
MSFFSNPGRSLKRIGRSIDKGFTQKIGGGFQHLGEDPLAWAMNINPLLGPTLQSLGGMAGLGMMGGAMGGFGGGGLNVFGAGAGAPQPGGVGGGFSSAGTLGAGVGNVASQFGTKTPQQRQPYFLGSGGLGHLNA